MSRELAIKGLWEELGTSSLAKACERARESLRSKAYGKSSGRARGHEFAAYRESSRKELVQMARNGARRNNSQ